MEKTQRASCICALLHQVTQYKEESPSSLPPQPHKSALRLQSRRFVAKRNA